MFKYNKLSILFPVVVGIILLGIVITIAVFSIRSSGQDAEETPQHITQEQQEKQMQSISVTRLFPEENVTLIAGTSPIFTMYFNAPVNDELLTFSLIPTDNTQNIPPTRLRIINSTNERISVQTQGAIQPYNQYAFVVQDKLSGRTLKTQIYYVGLPQPTSLPQNNEALKAFLPYETDTYSLEYLASRNVYLFHFKYNPNNPEQNDVQFENAKTQATQFIESKGINLSSITIEWQYK